LIELCIYALKIKKITFSLSA